PSQAGFACLLGRSWATLGGSRSSAFRWRVKMKVNGSCHCGNIEFDAEVDTNTVVVCHCTDCQALTGSAFRVIVPAKVESFRMRGGSPQIYVKVAESGAKRVQAFCPVCGTPL